MSRPRWVTRSGRCSIEPTHRSSNKSSSRDGQGHHLGLRWRILALVGILLPVCAQSLYSIYLGFQSAGHQIAASNLERVSLGAKLLEDEFNRNIQLASAIAAFPGVREGMMNRNSDDLFNRMRVLIEHSRGLTRLTMVDGEGRTIATVPRAQSSASNDRSDETWFQKVVQQRRLYVSEVYTQPELSDSQVIAFAAPVLDERGRLIGVFVMERQLRSVAHWLTRVSDDDTSRILLVTPGGAVVTPSIRPLGEQADRVRQSALFERGLAGQVSTGRYVDPLSGEEVITTVMPVKVRDHYWVVAAQQPVSQAYAPVRKLLLNTAAAALVLSGLAVLAGGALSRNAQRVHRLNRELDDRNRRLQEASSIIESSDDAVIGIRPDLIISSWNQGALKTFGYTARNAVGQSVLMLVPEAEREPCRQRIEQVLAGRGHKPFEAMGRCQAGQIIHVAVTLSAIFDNQGQVVGVSAIIRDITERIRAEENLRASEKVFRMLVEGVTDHAMFMLDEQGRVASWNSGAQRLTGWATADAVLKPLETFFLADDVVRGVPRRLLERALAQGGFEQEGVRVRSDGTTFWAEQLVTPLYDEVGKLRGYVTIVRDVSHYRRTEALRQSEALKHAIIQSAMDCVITTDDQGRILEFNPTAQRTFGYSREQALGAKLGKLIEPGRSGVQEAVGWDGFFSPEAAEQMLNRRIEMSAKRRNGAEFPIEVSVTTTMVDGQTIYTIFIRDITEQRASEEAIRRANAELKHRQKEMEQFLAIIAHDLKHPAVGVQGLLVLLKRDCYQQLSETNRQFVDLCLGECDRIKEMLSQLSQLGRIAGVEPSYETVQLDQLIESVLRPFLTRLDGTDIQMRVQAVKARVLMPRLQVQEALVNLLENAIKYGCADGRGQIEVECKLEGSLCQISVTDQGPGIDPRQHERVFEPFRRLMQHQHVSGSGMGLTGARRLMQRVGGELRLESEVGKGARFILRLPVELRP